ncbi:hypothetical protein GV794_01355 [Nocardia cyriacigeorgica]|uniref:Uncharacterized protein n=1 Tax=Nocardia cyriacigeorgica TaxID=135487 RepID=A0A6P1D3H7_9NOCA|nr:hypothetical protein [Nocardia cyriacigeorgica]NEW40674.1 hypothetical protein [Nocardia cyriacigeorgica]NEW44079.1 hypothetical protein [Nocardia cyriacigeorgica]NEW51098.1 hypothetical protein [Nocardia cyriacigeorgica]NEW54319.1 hypothetical protein [Nocardia cyriacigeorgica]
MEPERTSPYWDAIVGDDWPEISPGAWHALENQARTAAAALNTGDAARARLAFDQAVRSSARLQPIKDEMLAQQGTPQAFADALIAASEVFRDAGALVYRTRNRILDIVDDATARIAAVHRRAEEAGAEEAPTPEQTADTVANVLGGARAEVRDVVAAALRAISPAGLPSLAVISQVLGEPGPWESGGSRSRPEPPVGPSAPPPTDAGDRRGPEGTQPRSPDGRPGADAPAPRPTPESPDDRFEPIVAPDEMLDPAAPPSEAQPPADLVGDPADSDSVVPGDQEPAASQPADSPPQTRDTGPHTPDASAGAVPPTRGGAGPVPTPWGSAAPDSTRGAAGSDIGSGDSTGPDRSNGTDSERMTGAGPYRGGGPDPQRTGAESGRSDTDESGVTEPGNTDTAIDAAARTTASKDASGAENSGPESSVQADSTAGMPPPMMPMGAPAPVSATAPGSPPPSVPVKSSGPSVGPAAATSSPSTAAPAPPVAPAKAPVVGAQPPAGTSAPGSGTAAVPGTAQPANRTIPQPEAVPADPEQQPEDIVRHVVGAAMAAAAGPSFVLGEKVDGDLVLARTLLAGVLAAATHVTGPESAVAVMRHSGGVSAFLTSNEGRGWLPAGVFVPRELSTPWVWSVSEGSGWEGISDPARVLAEFALAWGRKSGARLTALASSMPIDTMLGAQLGEVATAGSVDASPAMNLSAPGPRLIDRLELTGSPRMLARVAETPDDEIHARCVDLAIDAHQRLARAGMNSSDALGVPALRERILPAIRQGRDIPDQSWDELRDLDDLLAVSMVSRRFDATRVALGELRSDQPGADASALRAMVFERRCDELVLLLNGEPTRQRLRDAMYAHAQIAGHSALAEPAAGSARPARRPTVSAPRVS